MATRNYESEEVAKNVAKEAIWLAYNACGGPSGFGVLQDAGAVQKDQVWQRAYDQGDYAARHGDPEDVDADYVFGRMMKLYFRVSGNAITHSDSIPHPSYQGWSYRYKTYDALFDAAEKSVIPQQSAA